MPKRRPTKIVHKSDVPKPGEHYGIPVKPYVRRNGMRPKGDDTYETDGVAHRFDGKCHAACPNVR